MRTGGPIFVQNRSRPPIYLHFLTLSSMKFQVCWNCVACKNPVQTGKKIKFSILEIRECQKSSADKSLTQTFVGAWIPTLNWCIWPFFEYLCPRYKFLCQICQIYTWASMVCTSKLPKFYRNYFKPDLYCCIWYWFEMSA